MACAHMAADPWGARRSSRKSLRCRRPSGADTRAESPDVLLRELESLETHANKVTVPLSYASELYELRSNIYATRRRLNALKPTT
ncbi:MAG TPA: hypothetical protein VJU61_00360 [Polyangiaceae bacterium]|nr:hypothetical protein [Polyangiaceae bacterium]